MQNTPNTPKQGDTAPNITLLDTAGQTRDLESLQEGSPHTLAVIFIRHFGCQFCREHIATLKPFARVFKEHGIHLIVIGNGTPEQAAAFQRDMATPFPIYTDPTGTSQQQYGLIRATNTAMFRPGELLGGIRALRKGFIPHRPQGDGMQLAGQFLIGPDGIIIFAERATMISEILEPHHLIDAARIRESRPA